MYQNFITIWTVEPLRRVRKVFPRRLGCRGYGLGVWLGRLGYGLGFLRDDFGHGLGALLGPSGLSPETLLHGPKCHGIGAPLPRPWRRAGHFTGCAHGDAASGAKFVGGAYALSARATSPKLRTAYSPLSERLIVWL